MAKRRETDLAWTVNALADRVATLESETEEWKTFTGERFEFFGKWAKKSLKKIRILEEQQKRAHSKPEEEELKETRDHLEKTAQMAHQQGSITEGELKEALDVEETGNHRIDSHALWSQIHFVTKRVKAYLSPELP